MKKISVPPLLKDALAKPEFPDDWTKLRKIDPLVSTYTEFDWEGLGVALGEAQENAPDHCAEVAEALSKIIEFTVFGGRSEKPYGSELEAMGRRLVAFAWIINPALFDGVSMRQLARRFKLSRGSFCRDTGDASRAFKMRNRSQSHASNFKPNLNAQN